MVKKMIKIGYDPFYKHIIETIATNIKSKHSVS